MYLEDGYFWWDFEYEKNSWDLEQRNYWWDLGDTSLSAGLKGLGGWYWWGQEWGSIRGLWHTDWKSHNSPGLSIYTPLTTRILSSWPSWQNITRSSTGWASSEFYSPLKEILPYEIFYCETFICAWSQTVSAGKQKAFSLEFAKKLAKHHTVERLALRRGGYSRFFALWRAISRFFALFHAFSRFLGLLQALALLRYGSETVRYRKIVRSGGMGNSARENLHYFSRYPKCQVTVSIRQF